MTNAKVRLVSLVVITRPILCQRWWKKTDFLTKHACSLIEQAAREALTEKVFVKGPDYKNKFGVVFGDGLVTSTGEKHKGKLAPHQHEHC